MAENRKLKITNFDKIKNHTLDLCRESFAQKLITNNQMIDFSWEEYPHDIAMLAKMIVPDFDNYGRYKRETIEKIVYDTAIAETKALMKEIQDIGPLPERTWNNDNDKFRNIYSSCTHYHLVSWPIYYFKKHGSYDQEDPSNNNMEVIKEQALEKAEELAKKFFPEREQLQLKITSSVKLFFDQFLESTGRLFFSFK